MMKDMKEEKLSQKNKPLQDLMLIYQLTLTNMAELNLMPLDEQEYNE